MASASTVTIIGTVGMVPELRYTQSGAAVCNLSVAVNERVFDKQTEQWKDLSTSWYRISLWRDYAENVAESIEKGMRVIVTGELVIQEFDRKDGTKGNSAVIKNAAIGPDLAFATAKVTRSSNGGGNGGNGGGQGRGNGGGQSQGGQQGGGAPSGWGGAGNSYDEPPF